MNRRGFLQSLLGLSAAVAIPTPLIAAIEAVAPSVALPEETTSYVMSFYMKTTSAWQRVVIPFRSGDVREATERVNLMLNEFIKLRTQAGPETEVRVGDAALSPDGSHTAQKRQGPAGEIYLWRLQLEYSPTFKEV